MIATFPRKGHPPLVVLLTLVTLSLAGAARAEDKAAKAEGKPFAKEDAEKLWRDKYADRLIYVNGREANRQQVDRDYLEEVAALEAKGAKFLPAAQLPADAAKVWNDKYVDKVFYVNERPVNLDKLKAEFRDELQRRYDSADKAKSAVEKLQFDEKQHFKASPPKQLTAEADGAAARAADVDPEERQLLAALDRRLPELNFDGVALSDVIDFLRDVSGANVFVDWRALEAGGVDRAAPVSVRVRNVTFAQALEMVLASASKATPLGYALKGGVVRVTTNEQIEKDADTRSYDVRDLVPGEMEMKELVSLITETVAPDSWRAAGGATGSVHVSRHKLIVTASEPNHRQVRAILRMLREEPKHPVSEEAATAAQVR